jgi:hypothetical protein
VNEIESCIDGKVYKSQILCNMTPYSLEDIFVCFEDPAASILRAENKTRRKRPVEKERGIITITDDGRMRFLRNAAEYLPHQRAPHLKTRVYCPYQ